MRIRFQGFELDEDSFLLTRDGERVPLRPKVFDLLSHLIRNRDRVVRREELVDVVWGSTAVCVGSLAGLVNELRGALGERGRGRSSIRTVHARGYQFVAEVSFPGGGAGDSGDRLEGPGSCAPMAGARVGPMAEAIAAAMPGASLDEACSPAAESALAGLNALFEAAGMAAPPSVLGEALLAHADGHAERLESILGWMASRRIAGRSGEIAARAGSKAEEVAAPDRSRVRRVEPGMATRSHTG